MKRITSSLIITLAVSVVSLSQAQTHPPPEAQAPPPSQRALPDDNLGYPVLIKLSNGSTGSGFYLQSGTALYLVTAKHVLYNPQTQTLLDTKFSLVSYSKDPAELTPNVYAVDLSEVPTENLKPHPSQDVVVVKLFTAVESNGIRYAQSLPGITAAQIAKSGIVSVAVSSLKMFDEVLVGNEVLLMGYPTSLGLQALPQVDSSRPLLRKGIVAGENPQRRSIVLDCPSYPGNSGGPVIEIDRNGFMNHFTIIGVVSEFVPYAESARSFAILNNSGYSIVTPMDFVVELLK